MSKGLVLVTGAAGYVGSTLCRQLLNDGYAVRGMDILNFGGESLLSLLSHKSFEFLHGDLRSKDDISHAVKGVHHIVHLAAIVGDPACKKDPELTRATNWEGSLNLLKAAERESSAKRFIFASTCSNYGRMNPGGFVSEESNLNPVSLYAELKVAFEKVILNKNEVTSLIPVSLRFATVYGLAARMRFDLTVNEFMREAACGRELVIFGEKFWRPYCHVEDIAYACRLVLEAPEEKVAFNVFGVGATEENYQKQMIAEEIRKLCPQAKIKFIHKDEDPRDYRVDFNKIKESLNFTPSYTVPLGLAQIKSAIENRIFSDPYSPKYGNL